MIPIYEQIVDQIKGGIVQGSIQPDEMLPSVRSLAKELSVSALTVKKAYDHLEEQGLIVTVHGKGSFVATLNLEIKKEEQLKEIQEELEKVIRKAASYQLSKTELQALFHLLMEEE